MIASPVTASSSMAQGTTQREMTLPALPSPADAGPQSSTQGTDSRTVVRAEPDCVKTRLYLVPWGTVAEKRLLPSRAPHHSPIFDAKWDACPFCFRNLHFSHSLERARDAGVPWAGRSPSQSPTRAQETNRPTGRGIYLLAISSSSCTTPAGRPSTRWLASTSRTSRLARSCNVVPPLASQR